MSDRGKGIRRPVTPKWIDAASTAIRSGEHGTHREIAEAVGMTQGYISSLIAGRYQTSTVLDALNQLLGLGDIGLGGEVDTPLLRELVHAAEGKDEETIRSLIDILKRINR